MLLQALCAKTEKKVKVLYMVVKASTSIYQQYSNEKYFIQKICYYPSVGSLPMVGSPRHG
jgi:hypothetical protein